MIHTMPIVHKTICEYCLSSIEYSPSDLVRDRFDTIYFICPTCESQVEVGIPDEIESLEDIPIATDEAPGYLSEPKTTRKYSARSSRYSPSYEEDDEDSLQEDEE
jgi:hypothetical protein